MTPAQVLHFWFGDEASAQAIAKSRAALWWGAHEDTDDEVRNRFGALHSAVAAGEHADWNTTPQGRLALILVLDQFSRMLFRGRAQAFAFDEQARELCRETIARGKDAALRPIERVFVYLPLEHSESVHDQKHSVACFSALAVDVALTERVLFANYLDFAQRHHAVIARFKRFPHRNAALGRPSTEAELAFLRDPGSSF